MSPRDIEGDYRRAYIAEYESYKRAGRHEEAKHIASILRTQFGHEVESKPRREEAVRQSAPERADQKAPEDTAEPRPRRRTRASSDDE